jgi:hypothetical protein
VCHIQCWHSCKAEGCWAAVCHMQCWHSCKLEGCWAAVCHIQCWHSCKEEGCWTAACHIQCWHSCKEEGCWTAACHIQCWHSCKVAGCWTAVCHFQSVGTDMKFTFVTLKTRCIKCSIRTICTKIILANKIFNFYLTHCWCNFSYYNITITLILRRGLPHKK